MLEILSHTPHEIKFRYQEKTYLYTTVKNDDYTADTITNIDFGGKVYYAEVQNSEKEVYAALRKYLKSQQRTPQSGTVQIVQDRPAEAVVMGAGSLRIWPGQTLTFPPTEKPARAWKDMPVEQPVDNHEGIIAPRATEEGVRAHLRALELEQKGAPEHPDLAPKKRVYLSGPISNVPDKNIPLFAAQAERYRSEGFEVINPHEISAHLSQENTPWTEFMNMSLRYLPFCDMVVVFDGWTSSAGAIKEVLTAKAAGIPVFRYDNLAPVTITSKQALQLYEILISQRGQEIFDND